MNIVEALIMMIKSNQPSGLELLYILYDQRKDRRNMTLGGLLNIIPGDYAPSKQNNSKIPSPSTPVAFV